MCVFTDMTIVNGVVVTRDTERDGAPLLSSSSSSSSLVSPPPSHLSPSPQYDTMMINRENTQYNVTQTKMTDMLSDDETGV